MALSGNVELTIGDGSAGTISVPASTIQVVIGCSSTGTAATVLATRDPRTLQTTFGYGPMPEAAAMAIAAGGSVLAMKATSNAAGAVNTLTSPLTVSAATNASPVVLTTGTHGLTTGAVVVVTGVGGTTGANGTWVVIVLSATTFSLTGSTGGGVYTSGGSVAITGSMQSGTGTTTVVFSGAANDDYQILLTCTKAGTFGTTGIQFTVSLDAGRTTGPAISLGTALTYTIPQTGITATFITATTWVVGDTARCTTKGPAFDTAGILACFTALQGSPYAATGWGSMHLAATMAGVSAANAATIAGYVDNLATAFLYSRLLTGARDNLIPAAWGGAGETDSTWSTSVLADFASASAKRVAVDAGFYNMSSAYPNPAAGLPRYRRSLSWAHACRIVAIQPQIHEGHVGTGGLKNIVLDPNADASDGWNYHNEYISGPVFDGLTGGAGHLGSARTRPKKAGYFLVNPMTLASTGSDFQILPRGRVMDIACDIVQQVAGDEINSTVRLNPNGTIFEVDAGTLKGKIEGALYSNMTAVGMISSAVVTVDLTNNVATTSRVKISGTIVGLGYVLQIDFSLAYGTINPVTV